MLRRRTQRATADEALGDFCHRVTIPAVEKYMESYVLGTGAAMASPFAPPAPPAPDGESHLAPRRLHQHQHQQWQQQRQRQRQNQNQNQNRQCSA